MIFNPLHYLALLEQKTNALDQSALQGLVLPEEFAELRRQMEARLGKRGRREYVQVLRLLETFSMGEVAAAVREALRFPAIAFDAVKHLLLCAIERRPPKLRGAIRPLRLPQAARAPPELSFRSRPPVQEAPQVRQAATRASVRRRPSARRRAASSS